MLSSSRVYNDVNTYESMDTYGARSQSSVEVSSEYRNFYVTNGLVQGNKRTPNPVYFSKTRTHSQIRTEYSQRTGVPFRPFTFSVYRAGVGPWSYSTSGNLYPFGSSQAALEDQCLKRIFEQMRYGSGNLVVDLAESAETIRMIRNATSVRKMARQFVKEVVKPYGPKSSKRLKYATDKWLEYRYGWLPLVSSTYELLKTLSRKVDAKAVAPLEARAGWSDEYPINSVKGGFATTPQVSRLTVRQSRRVQMKVRMRPRTTLELYDFTSLNPAGIAWELVPLSFVADWFVNVGETLSLWEDHILFANRFIDGFETLTAKEDVLWDHQEYYRRSPPLYWPSGQEVNGYLIEYTNIESAVREWRYKNRFLLGSLPRPGGLRVEVKLNAKRLLDAASLLRGAFGKV